ncbi:M56 family metallopeptidase [Flavobacterium sp. ARAG 55.4]|uniref:M56 family metallopeptidase n=1 Tax=Flavobacterium sp. ARAG 55.4 TaxID=3451357 RepID=UPI003F462C6C
MENILEHEKVHSSQNHSVDVLVARMFCIAFWFNPLIWLYKKVMVQNLEFIADREASKNISDKKAYQLTLLKITRQENCVSITNHFYQSLIKKRIIMLNQNQSKKWNSWKYITVFPALIAFVFLFQIKIVAQEKEVPKQEKETKSESDDLKPSKIEKDLKTLSENKEIIINGEKSNQEELDKLNPDNIEKIDVATISGKKTILVTTKTNKENKDISPKPYDVVYIDGEKISQSELENNFVFRNVKDVKIVEGKKNKTYYITTTNSSQNIENHKFEFIITKNTSDEEIKEKREQIKNLHDIDLTFFNIKRNSNGEITNIESTNDVFPRSYKQSNNPIEPFKFFYEKKTNGGFTSGYETLSNSISRIIDDKRIDYKKAVILIDGEQSDYQTLEKLNPKDIKQVITKDINSRWPENKKYFELYGEKALYGILIAVETKNYLTDISIRF